MNEFLSSKIRNISFLCMVMVVQLHSYNLDIKQFGEPEIIVKDVNWAIQNFISNGLTRIAVPFFFIISGYLFVSPDRMNFLMFKNKNQHIGNTVLFLGFFGGHPVLYIAIIPIK